MDTLRRVLETEPDHDAARRLHAQLEDPTYASPVPALPPEEDVSPSIAPGSLTSSPGGKSPPKPPPPGNAEPIGMLDDEPLPYKYDVDECVAIAVDPNTMFVYWEVRDVTLEHLRATRPGGVLALRVLLIVPSWDGPRTAVRDQDVGASLGDWFVRDVPMGAIVRAAIGWRTGDVFLPIAHSPALETPPGQPFPSWANALVRWTRDGVLPVGAEDLDAAELARALGIALRRLQARGLEYTGALGSSEQRARLRAGGDLSASASWS
jgi:hypothetical protein